MWLAHVSAAAAKKSSMKINCSFQGERKTSEKYNGRIEYPF